MAEDRVSELYDWSEAMTAAGEAVKDKHEDNYKTIIEYAKTSDTRTRILAAQLIARFFKYFPDHEESAFDSIVDLCESPDVDVRKHATLAMIAICKDCKHLVSKAADILIQLYQTNQASEVNLINLSLTTLLNLDIQKFLQSFFTNFEDGTEVVRERALKFLSSKIHLVDESALTKEVEEQLLTYSKKAMEDVTKDEFITFVGILSKLKIAKTAVGQAMIVLVIKSQAELSKDFDVNDTDALDKFLLCTKHTIPLLSQYNRASEYINYICLKILPHLDQLTAGGNDLNVLQVLAEMSPHIINDDIPTLIDLTKCQEAVYSKLLNYLPLPGDSVSQVEKTETKPEAEVVPQEEEQKDEAETKEPQAENQSQVDFQFTHIEYLIYTFHQFGRLQPEFFTEARQSEIKTRLSYLSGGCRKYMEILSAQLRTVKSGEDLKKEENKLRSVALRTTKNISTIVMDFLRKPPQFKASILLSCKPLTTRPAEATSAPTAPSNNNNNNNNTKSQAYKGQHNNGNYNRGNFNRQVGQKHKYRQSYHNNDRNKRPRHQR